MKVVLAQQLQWECISLYGNAQTIHPIETMDCKMLVNAQCTKCKQGLKLGPGPLNNRANLLGVREIA